MANAITGCVRRSDNYEPGGRTFESCWAHQPSLKIRNRLAKPVILASAGCGDRVTLEALAPPAALNRAVKVRVLDDTVRCRRGSFDRRGADGVVGVRQLV
jgi:hypothetical protein